MSARGTWSDVVVLAGAGGVRVVGSTREAEGVLEAGFRPIVVLLGPGIDGRGVLELVRRKAGGSSRGAVPVLRIREDGERLRLTPLGDEAIVPSAPEQLGSLLQVLEELCAEPMQQLAV